MEDYYKSLSGEEKLHVEVLRQAIRDLQHPEYSAQAWRFFIEDSDNSVFQHTCKLLSIDPNLILTKVKNYYLYGKSFTRTTNSNSKIPDEFATSISIRDLGYEYDEVL